VENALAERLVGGIAAQDETRIASCFAERAEFRALTPNGVRERSGRAEAGGLIARWFGDSTILDLVESRVGEVADRLHVTYRFTGVEEGEPYVVEQHLYCDVRDGLIARADLLCSGFLPRRPQ
jgi:SnoaL-like domain